MTFALVIGALEINGVDGICGMREESPSWFRNSTEEGFITEMRHQMVPTFP